MKPGKLIPPVLLLGLGACAYWLYFVQETPEAPSVLTPAAEQAIATLHKQGIDTEAYSTRLTEAAAAGDTELVRLLLTAQADSAAADAQFNTALHKAAAAGHADTCRALVELGCAVAPVNYSGQTPLHLAAANGHTACVQTLAELGAALNSTNTDGHTPLMLATMAGHAPCVQALVTAGAHTQARTIDGKTIYELAAKHPECAAILEQTKQQAELPTHLTIDTSGHSTSLLPTDGLQPDKQLLEALERNDTESLLQMLNLGANANATAADGEPPLHKAAAAGHAECVRILLAHGAVATTRANGVSALIKAIDANSPACVELLLQAGADANELTTPGYTPVHRAAEKGHWDCLSLLLAHNAHPNALYNGQTALMMAAAAGHHESMALLIAAKADAAICTPADSTALHLAAYNGHAECVHLLLQIHADPNTVDRNGNTPLCLAAQRGHTACVSRLLREEGINTEHKNKFGQAAMHLAALAGHADCITALAAAGVSPDTPESTDQQHTPLHLALAHQDPATVQALLQAGANLQAVNALGETPLDAARKGKLRSSMKAIADFCLAQDGISADSEAQLLQAAAQGNTEQVHLLLNAGALTNKTAGTGAHALMQAAGHGHTEIVQLLLAEGALVNVAGEDGSYPLHAAAAAGHTDCVKALLQAGADITMRDAAGKTALNLASAAKHEAAARAIAIAENLLKKGYKPENYAQALLQAAEQGEHSTLAFLIEAGANIHHRDDKGMTALHKAAATRYTACVKKLLEAGANPNAISEEQMTPLILAAAAGHVGNVRALLAGGADANLTTRADSPASAAIKNQQKECIYTLLDSGVSVNAVDTKERPLLYWAILAADNHIVAELIKRGAEVNATISETPLLNAAVELNNLQAIELMYASGKLNPRLRDGQGRAAIHIAAITGNIQAMAMLIKIGQNITLTDHAGMTVLHHSAAHGHTDMLGQLLRICTDAAPKDNRGQTPLDLATKANHQDCIRLLKAAGGDTSIPDDTPAI